MKDDIFSKLNKIITHAKIAIKSRDYSKDIVVMQQCGQMKRLLNEIEEIVKADKSTHKETLEYIDQLNNEDEFDEGGPVAWQAWPPMGD